MFAAIYLDEPGAMCPWEDCDGLNPMVCRTADGTRSYGEPPTATDLVSAIPHGKFRRSKFQERALGCLDFTLSGPSDIRWAVFREERARLRNFGKSPAHPEHAKEAFLAMVEERESELSGMDMMAFLEALAGLAGVETYRAFSRGYVQSCWADLLLFSVPGDPYGPWPGSGPGRTLSREERRNEMKSEAELWGHWAWGDVYGYVLEDEEGNELCAPGGRGGNFSCWGFYGNDPKASGIEDAARSDAMCYLDALERERREAEYWAARGVVTES